MLLKAVFLFAIPALHAQNVEGVVSNRATHAPVSGVTVTLTGPATLTAVADAAGGFRFPLVEPGEYKPTFRKPGYVPGDSCLKPFRVNSNAPVRLACEMEQLAQLQGRVLYPDGRPVPRATVWVVLFPMGGVAGLTADEQGRFVIGDAGDGPILLRASAPRGAAAPDGEVWAPTFYPSATERSSAEPIRLRAGSDVSGYDIRLRSVPAFQARGMVRDENGAPAARVTVELAPAERNMGAEQQAQTGEDGSFELRNVRPGDWLFRASLKRGGIELKGVARQTVTRHDIDRVDIRLAAPFALQGFVEREEARDAKGERKVTAVYLVAAEPGYSSTPSGFHKQDGSITIAGVYPGRYVIQPLGVVPGYYLESVKLGDREVLGQEIELADGMPPFRVIYRPDAPRVSGVVEHGEGAEIALIPRDDKLMNDLFIRTATASRDGRFEIGSLRPGDYYAFAFDRVDGRMLRDPSFVSGLAARAVAVHVEKGESASINLKVMSWPQ